MRTGGVEIQKEIIQAFCQKWMIQEFALFGSVLRDDFRPDSDIDILVIFSPDAHWGLADLGEMKYELRSIYGRDVDLIEKEGLRNPFRRKEILGTRKVINAQPSF
jgi:uncharacterized protein